MTSAEVLPLFGAAVIAGGVNSIAGGGTLLTFPTLVAVGVGELVANATSTCALVPGSAAAAWGYANQLAGRRRTVLALCTPSLVGGAIGAYLTRVAGVRLFGQLVPWLVLAATLLFVVQEPLARRLGRRAGPPRSLLAIALFQFVVAIYGGFFGAGMGILILAALAQLGWTDVHEMNALKNVIAVCINGVAALTFMALGLIVWPLAGIMALGAMLGGYGGAKLARRVGRKTVRRAIIAIGFAIAAWMFVKQLG